MDMKTRLEEDRKRSVQLGHICKKCGDYLDHPSGYPSYCKECAMFYDKGTIIEGKEPKLTEIVE